LAKKVKENRKKFLKKLEIFLTSHYLSNVSITQTVFIFLNGEDLKPLSLEGLNYLTLASSREVVKVALLRINKAYRDKYNLNKGEIKNTQTVELEHILPKNIKNTEWSNKFNEEEHGRFVNSLGNVCLLQKKMNSKFSNDPFKKKKEMYLSFNRKQLPPIPISNCIAVSNDWTKEDIANREKELKDMIISELSLKLQDD